MEQHSGDFSVTVRDVRQLNQTEGDLLTLLWVLEGSVCSLLYLYVPEV